MLLKRLITVSLLAAAASAYMVPEGTEDGIYEHYIDVNGQEVHLKIAGAADLPDADISPYTPEPIALGSVRGVLTKRAGYSCGGAKDLHHGDLDAANANLDWQCDTYGPTKPRHNYYALRGDTVAFFCNFMYNVDVKCTSRARQDRSRGITNACGWYNSGWFDTGVDGEAHSYGYDRGRCFCGECV